MQKISFLVRFSRFLNCRNRSDCLRSVHPMCEWYSRATNVHDPFRGADDS